VPVRRFRLDIAYDGTVAVVWFATAVAAEAAGFQLPTSQRTDDAEGDS
jgi:large subunit ribosomal protein L17